MPFRKTLDFPLKKTLAFFSGSTKMSPVPEDNTGTATATGGRFVVARSEKTFLQDGEV